MEQMKDFTKGPILGPLLAFSMPILLALFLQALYGAVDLLVAAWWMSRATGRLFFIGLGIPCATVVQIIACFVFFAHKRRGLQTSDQIANDREKW